MSKKIDLTGQIFGRLTVVKECATYISPCGKKCTKWLCKCDCGKEVTVSTGNLRSGHTKSCGCYNREKAKERVQTHGKRNTKLYTVWCGMKERCYNTNDPAYKWYGFRGITVCEEWKKFEFFYEWAMSNGYADGLTIDRKDVNGNYEPNNCRWVTMQEQANNKRNNHNITYNGETRTMAEWAREMNIGYKRLSARLCAGWSVERALTEQKRNIGKERALICKN